jgi:hypothetical protein
MSGWYQTLPEVFSSKYEYVDQYGNVYAYDLAPWSRGSAYESKSETIRRPRPSNLSDFSSLTGQGHTRSRNQRNPVTFTIPLQPSGHIRFIDADPALFTSNGSFLVDPIPDWQTALRTAVKDQKVNLAQTLAEYPQAQRMFADNATAIAKALRSLRRGDAKGAAQALRAKPKQLRGTISNRWLELQYGWMPLLSDLYGSVAELQAGLQRPRYRKIKVRRAAEIRENRNIGNISYLNKPGYIDASVKVVAKVTCYLKQDSSVSNRLGFTNPVNLAWELLPYSFVIDWFIPIGDWLNSLDAEIGVIEAYGTVSTKTKRIMINQFGGWHYILEDYHRSTFQGLPMGTFPSYSPSVGWKNVANALALLSQLKR